MARKRTYAIDKAAHDMLKEAVAHVKHANYIIKNILPPYTSTYLTVPNVQNFLRPLGACELRILDAVGRKKIYTYQGMLKALGLEKSNRVYDSIHRLIKLSLVYNSTPWQLTAQGRKVLNSWRKHRR